MISDATQDAVCLVAERLASPEAVGEIASRESNREPVYGASVWNPASLSHGLPGTAMLFAVLARSDPAWMTVAHRHIAAAADQLSTNPSNGLFAGPAALLAVVQQLPTHYQTLRRNLLRWVAADQKRRLDACLSRDAAGVGWHHYDVINGLGGTARLLLVDEPDAALATLRYLVQLTRPIEVDGTVVPGWWVPSDQQPTPEDSAQYPRGDFNLGLAHGITGVLAVLSCAAESDVVVPGLDEAANRIAEWLLARRQFDDLGAQWPCRIGWDDEIAPDAAPGLLTRAAWCYGTAGVAHTLYRAGRVFGKPAWQSAAASALRELLHRPEGTWLLDGPTICHGYSGLLRIIQRLAAATGDAEFRSAQDALTRRILTFMDEECPFGFAHVVPDSPYGWQHASGQRRLDIAGLLEGAAGVALVLEGTDPAPIADWDTALLLS